MITITNPIQKGFYPDPSICRVREEYYMVHSTFAYAPGIPVFKSNNLRDWQQIGHVLEREEQLCLKGARVSQGMYAPTIRYYNEKFYVICTNVSGGGNFYVTADDAKGPWSDPIYLKDAPGIDPSLFFDSGTCYYVGQRAKENAAYYGDCEIWIQELDLEEGKLVGESISIFDGSMKHTIWAEGPHLYHKDNYYYLLLAEGGTAYDHSVVVARSLSVSGPYESCPHNPVLTHRHLGHSYPIQCIGHGDLVESPCGDWFMVMLGTRPRNGCAELGRETFLAEVKWEEDWPVVNPLVGKIMEQQKMLFLPGSDKVKPAGKGDILWTSPLDMRCLGLRENPATLPHRVERGRLFLPFKTVTIEDNSAPSFICTRLLSRSFEAWVELEADLMEGEEAGLIYFYDESHYVKSVVKNTAGVNEAVIIKRIGEEESEWGRTAVTGKVHTIYLKGEDQRLCVEADQRVIADSIELRELCSEMAGGFTGCTIGVYAASAHEASGQSAAFGTLYLDFMD